MVKRVSYSSYIYLLFALIVLLVSWEHNRTMAAVVESDIPEESIRLRILANSDSVQDQALKRRVRDAIVEQMNTWVSGPTTLEEARAIIAERIPELTAVVEREVGRAGYSYTSKVELGMVPFPAKMYGNKVYPAGDYEALRVTIGSGAGQNWWCVLFPPLCFVEAAKGEPVMKDDRAAQKETRPTAEPAVKKTDKEKTAVKAAAVTKKSASAVGETASVKDADGQDGQNEEPKKKKVRFFFWEKIKSWFA